MDWRPPHAYVPGLNERHPEKLFDFLKADISTAEVNDLPQTTAWRYGKAFLQEGYFWEAHELFEPLWMACPPNSAEKLYVQSIIQSANAALKEKMGQGDAAAKINNHALALRTEAQRRSPDTLFGISIVEL